jgi:hypothetical protein
MNTRTISRALPGRIAVWAVALVLLTGSVASVSAQVRGGLRSFGHMSFGGHPRFHSSFFSSRPFRFHHDRTRFFFGLSFGFPYYGYYPPVYYAPDYYYYPAYPPKVVYNVYPDYRPSYAPPSRKAGRDDADEYYLNRRPSPLRQDTALAQAVNDIQTAFRTGDITPLEPHVIAADKLIVQSQGRTRRTLTGSEYLDMTREALKEMHTVRFMLDQVEPGSNGAQLVYGTHVLRGDDGKEKVFRVSFVLKKSADKWIITEVSADPAK